MDGTWLVSATPSTWLRKLRQARTKQYWHRRVVNYQQSAEAHDAFATLGFSQSNSCGSLFSNWRDSASITQTSVPHPHPHTRSSFHVGPAGRLGQARYSQRALQAHAYKASSASKLPEDLAQFVKMT